MKVGIKWCGFALTMLFKDLGTRIISYLPSKSSIGQEWSVEILPSYNKGIRYREMTVSSYLTSHHLSPTKGVPWTYFQDVFGSFQCLRLIGIAFQNGFHSHFNVCPTNVLLFVYSNQFGIELKVRTALHYYYKAKDLTSPNFQISVSE